MRNPRAARFGAALAAAAAQLTPCLARAQEEVAEAPVLDSGNTAWMLTATALVLFMTIPGLSLFYAGLVRAKNALSVMMQCFTITALVTLLWTIAGYSLAFSNADPDAPNPVVGGLGNLFLLGIARDTISGSIPESVFMMFQMTFAIITPALIVGGFAERMKFSAVLWFMGLWLLLVYSPVAHWVWGGGWLMSRSVLDFAGGTVVHINAGLAALAACLVIGRRKGYPTTAMPPHSLMLTVVGAGMLWVGWFGFNAGSELAADGVAGMAMTVTQISTATAALTWMGAEWLRHGKPSVLGLASGAVAGLVAITPASGTAGPLGAIGIGFAAGALCFWGSTSLKRRLGYDDALDVFGVHGIGGFVGAILTGLFAAENLGGIGLPEGRTIATQLGYQALGAVTTVVYSGGVSYVILKAIDAIIGLRVPEDAETQGLDLTLHDERSYNL